MTRREPERSTTPHGGRPARSARAGVAARLGRALVAFAAVSALAVSVFATGDGCVLIEPSGELPRIPPTRPTIRRAEVVPSASQVLSTFPREFIVPVELADPTQPFEYAAFIDYNAATGEGLQIAPTKSDFDPGNTSKRVRVITVALNPPAASGRCHTVEILVALRFESSVTAQTAHTPAEPGGDIVTWFYNPSGDPAGCPSLDAGIDSGVDAGADADASQEGGVQ